MNFGRPALRIIIGGLFIGHGTQKLYGWFGGSGPEGTDEMMESLQMHPVRRNSTIAGATEAGCGALLVAGAATPIAAAGLIGTMITAIRKVHGKNGPWNANGGWEFNAVIIAALTTLVEAGPGKASLDATFGHSRGGFGKALCTLLLGAAVSTAAIELGRREAKKVAHHRAIFDRPRPGVDADSGAGSDVRGASGTSESGAAADADAEHAEHDVKSKTDIDSTAAKKPDK